MVNAHLTLTLIINTSSGGAVTNLNPNHQCPQVAWSLTLTLIINLLEDWTALVTLMDLLLYRVISSLTALHVEGHSRPEIFAQHGWTVDQLWKLHACFKHPNMLLQASDGIKTVLYTLGPRLPRIC